MGEIQNKLTSGNTEKTEQLKRQTEVSTLCCGGDAIFLSFLNWAIKFRAHPNFLLNYIFFFVLISTFLDAKY